MRFFFKPSPGAILNAVFWLALGFSGGWWLSLLNQTPVPLPPPIVHKVAAEPKVESAAASLPDYQQSLSEYQAAQQRQSAEADLHRAWILSQAERLVNENDQRGNDLLDRFLDINAADPRAMFLKARAALADKRFEEALDTVLELRQFAQTEIPATQVNNLLSEIVSQYAEDLGSREQFDELINLYRRMTQAVPSDLGYYYKLGRTFYNISRYADAAAALNFSLYDTVWGERSRNLLQKIQQYLALEDGEQLSLENDNGQFYVNVQVNHISGVRLLIDTGASVSSLRPEVARRLGVDFDEDDTVIVQGVNSTFNAPRATVDTMLIGEVEVEEIDINIVEMGEGIDADGLLGMNVLGRFRFFIDQDRDLLFLGNR